MEDLYLSGVVHRCWFPSEINCENYAPSSDGMSPSPWIHSESPCPWIIDQFKK